MSFYDPMSADFPFTIGIEEEYQVVDPETRELRSYITQILERGQMILREQIKPAHFLPAYKEGMRLELAEVEAITGNAAAPDSVPVHSTLDSKNVSLGSP